MKKILAFITELLAKSNKKIIVGVLSALLVCTVAGIGTAVYLNSPEVVAANALSGFAKDLLTRDEFKAVTQVLQKGSVEASVSKFDVDDKSILPEGFSASGKLYFSKNALMLKNLNYISKDLELSGDVYLSKELAYVKESKILNNTYGVEWDSLANDLKSSVFAYGSGSDYEIKDKTFYDALITSLENPMEKKDLRELEKIAARYIKDIYKIICENAEFESESDKVNIGGTKRSARVVTISIDATAMIRIMEETYAYLCDDKSLISFLEEHKDSFALKVYKNAPSDSTATIVDMYNEMLKELGKSIEDACEDIEDSEFDLKIEIVTPKASSKLLKLTVSSGSHELSFDFGKSGIKKTDKITLDTTFGYEIVYEISEKGKAAYKAGLKINDENVVLINIDYNREYFDISLIESKYESIVITGSVSKNGRTTAIGVERIDRAYLDWYSDVTERTEITKTDLEIIIKTSDKMPKASSDFITIDNIKEADIKKWLEKLKKIDCLSITGN